MVRIAVFCAVPFAGNTGMVTVDLAALSILRRLAPDAEITLYTFAALPGQTHSKSLPFEYLTLETDGDSYFSSDIFSFWGDFAHSRSYLTFDRGVIAGRLSTATPDTNDSQYQQHFADFAKYLFLTELPDAKRRSSLVFGSTIITNTATDDQDELYANCFREFFSNVKAVYFRDAISAAKISPLRGAEATLGCDCALLLEDEDLNQLHGFKMAELRRGVGVFFGRSPHKLRMMLFSRAVGMALGEKCRWIHWLPWDLSKWKRLQCRWFGYEVREGAEEPGVLLSQLSSCKYVVTDTYHVCVNAWRLGIPAVCIGEGGKMPWNSISDKKKEVLYSMYGASAFYIFNEQLGSPRSFAGAVRRAVKVLRDTSLVACVRSNIREHVAMALGRLRTALRSLIADSHPNATDLESSDEMYASATSNGEI